ncbi:MAG: hypothetical protein HFH08_03630 [Bacilli bacterium]|nr:hypothetical protein [Bacilli bacterium]
MEREEKNESKKELEESVYSSLNIGSFLELKRRERDLNKNKETSKEPKKEVLKVTPLVKEEPKKEVITKKVVAAIEEKKIEQKKEISSKAEPEKVVSNVGKVTKKENSHLPKKDVEETKQDIHELLRKRKEEALKKESPKKPDIRKEEIKTKEKVNNEKKDSAETKKEIASKEKEEVKKEETIKKETELKKERKTKKRKNEKKKKEANSKKLGKGLIIGIVICVIMDLFACTGLFLTYGPVSYFRNLLVTSAMTTMSHKYLARTFYSDKTIEKILNNNVVKEVDENTNSSDINFEDGKDTGEYASIYEEQILKRDKNQLYKVIEIDENGYAGYLIAVYDASRVELVGANSNSIYGGAFLTDISKRTNAKVAINASGFYNAGENKGSTAVGTVIMDGKVVLRGSAASGYGGGLAGFNKDHVLVLTRENPETAIKNGMIDAVEFGPFLIVNGKAAEIKGDGGWGLASRTVLAQRKDGIVLFLVIDGRRVGHSIGIDMNGLIKILKRYNAHNAVNLDGGGSTTLVVDGKLTNRPCCSVDPTSKQRYVPNAWIVK